MKKTLYEILGVDKSAPQELIHDAYKLMLARLGASLDNGDAKAQNDIVVLKDAYYVLSNGYKRAEYDLKLQSVSDNENMARLHGGYSLDVKQDPILQPSYSHAGPVFLTWWTTSKTSLLLTGVFVLFLAYIGLGYFSTSSEVKIATKEMQEIGKIEAARVVNEGKLVDGVVKNEEVAIHHEAQVINRAISVAEEQEARRRQELEYRANANAQYIEIQKREQDARLEMQKRQLEVQRKQQDDYQKRIEVQKSERETRYYTCLNAAIDKYGSTQATAMCAGYR